MRAEDLRIIEMLRVDPQRGFPLMGSARFLMMGMGPLGRLGRDLQELLSPQGAHRVFFRFGYEAGLGMATNLAQIYQWDNDLEWFKAGSLMRVHAGGAMEDMDSVELDKAKGLLRFKGRWKDSFESMLHLNHLGQSQEPSCHVLCGIVSGYASAVLGAEVLVKETSCQAMGDDCCRFEGKPVAEWGQSPEEMRRALSLDGVAEEVARLKEALDEAREKLERSTLELLQLREKPRPGEEKGLIFRSEAMAQVLQLADKVAPTSATVLLVGETGTGKEVLARYIHAHSGRGDHPYLAINCAALPANLLESELFGHLRGAFTGADRDKKGLFVEAGQGTLFLDEVGEMPLELQAKLLRALQERQVRPVGGSKDQPVKARMVAATNRDLKEMVAAGRFREDLYYRLAVIPIAIPPLRARRGDLLPLARHFLAGLRPDSPGFAPEAVRVMEAHPWPGNVRELQNVVEYASVLAGDETITPRHLPLDLLAGAGDSLARLSADLPSEDELLRRYTEMVLEQVQGNKSQAARILGIGNNTLWRRLKSQEQGSQA